jgi:hypothetical protein
MVVPVATAGEPAVTSMALVLALRAGLAPGTWMRLPAQRSLALRRLLSCISRSTVVPLRSAISERVSPGFTV